MEYQYVDLYAFILGCHDVLDVVASDDGCPDQGDDVHLRSPALSCLAIRGVPGREFQLDRRRSVKMNWKTGGPGGQ